MLIKAKFHPTRNPIIINFDNVDYIENSQYKPNEGKSIIVHFKTEKSSIGICGTVEELSEYLSIQADNIIDGVEDDNENDNFKIIIL